jgi:hypothetical protein
MCRTYGAWDFRAPVTQALRPGLNCGAPTVLRTQVKNSRRHSFAMASTGVPNAGATDCQCPALKRRSKIDAFAGALKRSFPRMNAGAPTDFLARFPRPQGLKPLKPGHSSARLKPCPDGDHLETSKQTSTANRAKPAAMAEFLLDFHRLRLGDSVEIYFWR